MAPAFRCIVLRGVTYKSAATESPLGGAMIISYRKTRLAEAIVLATGIACAFSEACAGTVVVDRCNDQDGISYFGKSLRLAINLALENDTVDLSGLACSTISLERGELYVDKALVLAGPTDHVLTIDAHGASRVIHHYGTGSLLVNHLALANGAVTGDGGCVKSEGIATLQQSSISGCNATARGGGIYGPQVRLKYSTVANSFAYAGGGVYSPGVLLRHSTISGNTAQSGGGVGINGELRSYYSTINGNTAADGAGIHFAFAYSDPPERIYDSLITNNSASHSGGGVFAMKSSYGRNSNEIRLRRTTVSDNFAVYNGGGLYGTVYAVQSTISGNQAGAPGGAAGLSTYSSNLLNTTVSGNVGATGGIRAIFLQLRNCTIAFNRTPYFGGVIGGIWVDTAGIESTIITKNLGGNLSTDIGITHVSTPFGSNLISSANVPSIVSTADARLAPLAYHGGAVETHGLRTGSQAINAGSNPTGIQTDARGDGFPRVALGAPDIGAYERQSNDDLLFDDDFD